MSRTRCRHRPHHVRPKKETARVIFIYRDFRNRGFSHVGLGVAGNCTAKVLRRNGWWADVWACWTAEDLNARLRAAETRAYERNEVPPTHVVISAPWVDPDALHLLADRPRVAAASR